MTRQMARREDDVARREQLRAIAQVVFMAVVLLALWGTGYVAILAVGGAAAGH